MATLAGNTIASTYPLLLKIDSSGIDGTLRAVEDGDGTDSALSIATDSVLVKGDGVKLYFYDADGGEHISADASGNLTIGAAVDIILAGTAVNITADTIDLSDATKDVTLNAAVNALNFDSNTLSIDASNNRIGIGTAAPTEALTVSYGIGTESTLTGVLALEGTDTLGSNMVSGSGPSLDFRIPTNTGATHVAARIGCPREGGDEDANAGTLSFYTASTKNATATEKMTILKGGNVGIGTTAPSVDLVVSNGGANGIELNAGASASTIGAFNRSTSSYTDLTLETAKVTFAPQGTNPVVIDQGANDGEALSLKSSDVAHGVTDRTETDTYGYISKAVSASGGVFLGGLSESEIGITLDATSTADVTDKNTSANGNVLVRARKRDGTGDGQVGSNANLVAIENYDTTLFLFDAEGQMHATVASTTFDAYNDAQLVRAYDISHGKGVIESKFDQFIDYNHETLAKLKLVGREKDGTPNRMVNVTGMQHLHNGAIWQQYTEMQKMKEWMYDTMVEMLGKEKADNKLKDHDIKLLDNKTLLN